MKKLLAAICTAALCIVATLAAACGGGESPKPEKLKDGISLTITEGESKNIDLSEYISIADTEYAYTVNSSAPDIATVSVDGNTATVVAVAEGTATVTASADEVSVSFAVTVNKKPQQQPEEKPAPVFEDVDVEYDLKDEESKSVTLAPKSGANSFSYTYALKVQDSNVKIAGNKLTVSYGEAIQKQLVLVATYTDSENASAGEKTVEFMLNITVTDTRDPSDPTEQFKVRNGSFNNGLVGWTMEGEIGEISERGTFWLDEFPIFNEGKYFSGESKEGGKGTLASSTFVVGGINKITFKLGAAGNSECYITLEKTDGTVLAVWRNTKFEDVGVWDKDEIGKTQFACNLVTYVADLSSHEGETVKIVLHDNAEDHYGFFNFDELVTYYATAKEVPEGETAINMLADKSELQTALDNALTAQGDYTAESFSAYAEKVEAARAIISKVSATQTEVDSAKADIETAFAALELRVPEEKDDAEKSFHLLVGNSKELTISDFVDDKDLSNLTYYVEAEDGKLIVSEIADGKFTVTAGDDESQTTVTITVKYKDSESTVLTVTLTVTVTSENAPVLKHASVQKEIDVYSAENKTDITIDFSDNVENIGGLELSYTATLDGGALTLDGTSYTYTYESYTEAITEVVIAVTVSYNQGGENKELNYNYTLSIKDTTAYRVTNGGFDDGINGWTLSNPDLGGVNSNEYYWAENVPFNNDGNFFNAYFFNGEGKEFATGALTSSSFIIGGSGWITYKLGGAKNADKVFLDIIEKDTGVILARYYNNNFSDDAANAKVRGCTLVAYKADLSAYLGRTVYIRISDNAVSDYGLFFVDSFVTYYSEEPANGFADAEEVTERPQTIYDIYNGSFESDLSGWTLSDPGPIGAVTSDNGYWNNGNPEDTTNEYGKDGNKLFSWWSWDSAANEGAGAEINRENNIGTLTSSMFVLKAGKYVSFKFGGGGNRNVFIELVNAESGSVIAIFRNDNFADGRLMSYSYKVDELSEEALCYFRLVDNAVATNGWGCLTADDFRVNLDSAPANSEIAVNHINEYRSVLNGSFETGNLDGWTMMGELGKVVDTEIAADWYQTNEDTKDGYYLFTFHFNNGTENVNVEGNTGIVRSGAFILEKNGIISFRFGAAHNSKVYINVYTTGGRLLARFRNNAYTQDTVMVQYYYQFDNTEELSCYFEVVDDAIDTYGCIVMDDFCVNLDSVPENAVLGSDKIK